MLGRQSSVTLGAHAFRPVWNHILETDKLRSDKSDDRKNEITPTSFIKISILALIKNEVDKFKVS